MVAEAPVGGAHDDLVRCPRGKASECIESPDGNLCACCGCVEMVEQVARLRAESARLMEIEKLWRAFCNSPQTALCLGTEKDPNDKSVDWVEECTRLARDSGAAREVKP